MLWVVVWLEWPEDAIWVPSCSVLSGPHTGKDAKATSTDSPPKGYGTPNLVGVTGHWLVSGISVLVSVTGLYRGAGGALDTLGNDHTRLATG